MIDWNLLAIAPRAYENFSVSLKFYLILRQADGVIKITNDNAFTIKEKSYHNSESLHWQGYKVNELERWIP